MSEEFDNSNLYEGLFLMSQSAIGGGIGPGIDHVREILGRIDAQVITLRKWDERKLSYPVKRQKRGTFLLSLFRADGTRLTEIENTCNLSEQVLRVMITRCDHMGQVEFDAELEEAKTGEAEQNLRELKAKPTDTAKPDTAKPDTTKPDATKPDTAKADNAKPAEAAAPVTASAEPAADAAAPVAESAE